MTPASSWALLGIVLVALPVCVVMLLAILADLGRPVVACEDREWDALLVAVDAARDWLTSCDCGRGE
jgi:hypothetical protein